MRFFIMFILFITGTILGNCQNKILVLIIASDDKQYYVDLQRIWKSYMNLDPEHVEAYFIKGDPNLSQSYEIRDNTIWTKTEENYIPGLLNKTIFAMESMEPRINEFDFILRTNLSSFYVFPRLLSFLQTLPKKWCYCAMPCWGASGITCGSGAGFIITPDVMQMLIKNKPVLFNSRLIDDVAIGEFLYYNSIPLLPCQRMDFLSMTAWEKNTDAIPQNMFHFRTKNDHEHLRYTDEIYIQSELLKKFYSVNIMY